MLAMVKVNNKTKEQWHAVFKHALNMHLSVGHRIKSTKQLKCTLRNRTVSLKHLPVIV